MGFAPHVRSRYRQVHARHRSVKMCACVQFVHRSPVVVQNLVTCGQLGCCQSTEATPHGPKWGFIRFFQGGLSSMRVSTISSS